MPSRECYFEHIKCEVPPECCKGDVKQAVGLASLELRGKAETRSPGERSVCTGRREKVQGRTEEPLTFTLNPRAQK